MAQRRMFSLKIVDTDEFINMPTSARLLYYDMSMRADDDGFVSGPKKIMRMTGASEDDMRVLVARNFVIPFESGVCVIKDWKIHNYIQNDRYAETLHKNEKMMLIYDENNRYEIDPKCIQNVSKTDTQVRLGKVRLGKDKRDIYTPGVEKKNENPPSFMDTPFQYDDDNPYTLITPKEFNKLLRKTRSLNIPDYGLKSILDYYSNWILGKVNEHPGKIEYKKKSAYLNILKWVIAWWVQDGSKMPVPASWKTKQYDFITEEKPSEAEVNG